MRFVLCDELANGLIRISRLLPILRHIALNFAGADIHDLDLKVNKQFCILCIGNDNMPEA